jgi:hypothetical protein
MGVAARIVLLVCLRATLPFFVLFFSSLFRTNRQFPVVIPSNLGPEPANSTPFVDLPFSPT